jgi:hypothetical protein
MKKRSDPIRFPALIKIVYQIKNKVYCFSNKNVISIMTTNQGKFVD